MNKEEKTPQYIISFKPSKALLKMWGIDISALMSELQGTEFTGITVRKILEGRL